MPHKARQTIGIFGGTFDPIHFGHLRAALEINEQLNLDEMRLIPCKHPPHRAMPHSSAEHRLHMVQQAVLNSPLQVDNREMQREGPSYSVDTLMSLRREFPQASLCMAVGLDAFLGITSWYQWEKLLQLSNIIVMARAGWELPKTGITAELLETKLLLDSESLAQYSCGRITVQTISTLKISASQIRSLLSHNHLPWFLMPEKVIQYIQENELYGYNKGRLPTQQESIHS